MHLINTHTNTNVSIHKFVYTDVEYKLFQAMQYCFLGEDGLCSQLLQSVKRQINDDDANYESAIIFIKMLKTAIKPEEFRKKVRKLTEIYHAFSAAAASNKMLWYVKLDEPMLRKMANPIKE